MGRTIRVIGVVACLFTLWLVTTGVNGCMVEPDATAVLTLDGNSDETAGGDANHRNALVYGGGYGSGKLLDNLDSAGDGAVTLQWYTALEGQELSGMVTIISIDGQAHTHVPYKVKTYGPPVTATIPIMTKKKIEVVGP